MSASRPIRQDYFFDSERKGRARARLAFVAIALFGMIVLHFLDRALFDATYAGPGKLGEVESKAWYQILRQAGDVRTWFIAALAIGAHAFWRAFGGNAPRIRLGGVIGIAVAPVVSGVLAEAVRAILARQRPLADPSGPYEHHVWQGLFSGIYNGEKWFVLGNLGLPSSHAAVAMAAAVACARAFPGSGWILIPVAIGCGWTRMLSGRHFATDVFLGWVIGWIVGAVVAGMLKRVR